MREDIENINFMDAYIENTVLYAAGFGQNILFQYDIKEKRLYVLGVFDQFTYSSDLRAYAMFRYGDELFCFFENTCVVVSYHLKKGRFIYYYPNDKKEKSIHIHSVCRVGNDVWMFQEVFTKAVFVFSMKTGQFSIYKLEIDGLKNFDRSFQMMLENCVKIKNKIWRYIPGNAAFLVLDIQNMKSEIVRIGVNIPFYTISYEKGIFYILDTYGKYIVLFNVETNETMVWETGYNGSKERPFREISKVGNRLFLLPCFEKEIYYYEIYENQLCFISTLKYPNEFRKVHNTNSLFCGKTIRNQNELYLFPFGGNGMLCLNIDKLEWEYHPIKISKKDFIYNQIKLKAFLYEEQICFEEILNLLGYGCCENDFNNIQKNSIGSICWKNIKNNSIRNNSKE